MAQWFTSVLLRQVADGSLKATVVVCIATALLSKAHLPGVGHARMLGIVLIASTLISHVILTALVKLGRIDKSVLESSPIPARILPPPPPPPPPIGELDVDTTIVESNSIDAAIIDFDERVEIAVQMSIIRDIAKHRGITISFGPPAHDRSGN